MIIIIIGIIVLALLLFLFNFFFTTSNISLEKISPFECGINPIYGQTRNTFTIKYYLIGLLFLIFDLEISLLYPLATILKDLSLYTFSIAILFYLILTIGFFIEFKSGALHFTNPYILYNLSNYSNHYFLIFIL